MSKNTNLSFLTDFLTADIVNSRVGMNNVSPQATFDVTGTGKFSGVLTLGSTVSNGTYTYTLPSATGTLALTSDIPSVSGYVPYTGATQAVNLGYNSLSASFLRVDGAGPTLGSYLGFKHSTNVTTGADGYTSIYTFGTNTIAFKSISGATTRDFSFSMASITPGISGGRIYTLPDADGTIALTSAIPANPIGGTGTSGTIPVFTGSTTIGNSIIQSNATQVNVVGNGSQLLFDSLGSAKDGGIQYVNDFTLQMYNSRGVGSSIYLGNNNLDLNINPSSNPRLRITSGGNVLINSTTDNGARLQVSGTGTFSGNGLFGGATAFAGLAGGISVNGSTNSGINFRIADVLRGYVYVAGNLGMYVESTAGNVVLAPTGNAALTATSSGNVGIGTASPNVNGLSTALTINGSSTSGLEINANSVNQGYLIASTSAMVLNARTNIPLLFYTNDTERMRITSGGNVLLQSNNTLGLNTADGSDTGYLAIAGGGGDGINRAGHIYLSGNERVVDAGNVVLSAGNVSSGLGDPGAIIFRTAGSGQMKIAPSGNVLIGTTTDSGYKLYVSGNTYLDGTIEGATFSSTAGALTVNANTQFKSGFYRWNDTSTNLPEAGFFAVVIYGNCGNVVAQMATHFTNANTYVRSYNSSWTAWRRII